MSPRTAAWQGKHWIRDSTRERIYERDGRACVYCAATSRLSLDHLRSVAAGGSNATWNLVTACLPCNQSRGAKPLARFAGPDLARKLQARARRLRLAAERARAA